jgi:hypothetical protein
LRLITLAAGSFREGFFRTIGESKTALTVNMLARIGKIVTLEAA